MRDHDDPDADADTWVAERVILLVLLRDDHDERWAFAELRREIYDLSTRTLRVALALLEKEGVAVRLDEHVMASRCALRIDALDMVCI